MPAGDPSQITDIGGLPQGGKQAIENIAAAGDISLGTKGNNFKVPNANPGLGARPQGFNIGTASDFIAQGANKGGIISDRLSNGEGRPRIEPLDANLQSKIDIVRNATEIANTTNIPEIKAHAIAIVNNVINARKMEIVDDGKE
jgi:hypothetical protein